MDGLFMNRYRIESTRLPGWDYSRDGVYFVTICVKDRVHCFGEISENEVQLSALGKAAKKCWLEIPNHFPFVILDEFIIMPNHVHGIIEMNKQQNDINEIVNSDDGIDDVDCIGVVDGGGNCNDNAVDCNDCNVCIDDMDDIDGVETQDFASLPVSLPESVSLLKPLPESVSLSKPLTESVSLSKPVSVPLSLSSSIPQSVTQRETQYGPQSKNLASIIRGYKIGVTKYARNNNIPFQWQPRYHDRIIRNTEELNRIRKYIQNNPVKWQCSKDAV